MAGTGGMYNKMENSNSNPKINRKNKSRVKNNYGSYNNLNNQNNKAANTQKLSSNETNKANETNKTNKINGTHKTYKLNKKKKVSWIARINQKFTKKKKGVELIRYREGVDRWFLILVITMLCLGTVMIFSASYVNALEFYGDSYFFAKKQIFMALTGIAAMIFMSYVADYLIIEKLSVIFFLGILILNYLTPFFGKVTNGASRWFRVFGYQVQPSEFLKLAVVLLFAFYIAKVGEKMKTFFWGIGIPGLIILAITGAMYMQSHFSGLVIIALICLAIIFIGEAPWKWLAGFGVLGAGGVAVIIMFTSYASKRVEAWRDPLKYFNDGGWQIVQSLLAIGSGGLTGLGWGQSRQKHLYLPEPQNDFIFSIICEELGFIGALFIIAMFVLLIWRGFVIAYHAPNKFSAFVVMGIMIKVAVQFVLNLAVVTNTIPNTGITLPFFSYGGTALVVLMVEMGIILSISRYSYQDKP